MFQVSSALGPIGSIDSGIPSTVGSLALMYVCMYVCMYIIYIYIYICLYAYAYVYVCIYIYIYTHIHIHTYTYTLAWSSPSVSAVFPFAVLPFCRFGLTLVVCLCISPVSVLSQRRVSRIYVFRFEGHDCKIVHCIISYNTIDYNSIV